MKGIATINMSYVQQSDHVALTSYDALIRILDTLPGALFLIDDVATIVYANTKAQLLTDTTAEKLYGDTFWKGAPQFVSASLYQAVLQARQKQELTEVEYISPMTQTWLHVQLSPAAGGLILHFQERKKPVQSQLPSVDIPDGLQAGIAVMTPEGTLLEANEDLLEDIQIRREEVIGQLLTDAPWWSFSSVTQEQIRVALASARTGETVYFEALILSKEGKYHDLQITIAPHMNVDHQLDYLVFIGINVTVHKRAEAGIRLLVDTIPQFIWAARPDGFVTYNNQSGRDYIGMTTEQALGDGWIRSVHPDDRQLTLDTWQTAVQTNMPYEVEQRLYNRATGGYRWFLAQGRPIIDAQGTALLWVGTCTDIDDRKRMENALRQSQEQIYALMNSPIIGIFLAEEEKIIEANDTFLSITGYTREDLQAGRMSWMHMTPPEYVAITQQAHQEMAAHQSMTLYEKEYICKDDNRLPVLVGGVASPHHPLQHINFVLDNSARKELEQRKDDFISMASHELRTPLTALKLQVNRLKRKGVTQNIHDLAITVANMEVQINRATGLVEEFLDVSKIQEGKMEYRQEAVDLDALLREIIDTLQHINPSHTLVMHSTFRGSMIGDHDRLGQVFINLISNAIKYSPDANTIEIDLSANSEAVTISVHDYGLGIPREQHDKIFKRFYRAATGRQKAIPGLGMGLYIVAEIVKRHHGTITVDSEVGKGSTFTVTLPLKESA